MPVTKKPLILIVEDDPILRNLTERQLAVLGCDAISVPTGEDALTSTSETVALILMDISLPGIDGGHATMLIRELELKEHRKRVPIVALTAHSDRRQCALAGMDDFLQKPALLHDIKRVLEKWLPTSTP